MGYGRVNAEKAVWAVCDTSFYVDKRRFAEVDSVIGCDVYMERDTLFNSILKVRARNTVIIDNSFYLLNGSRLDIKKY